MSKAARTRASPSGQHPEKEKPPVGWGDRGGSWVGNLGVKWLPELQPCLGATLQSPCQLLVCSLVPSDLLACCAAVCAAPKINRHAIATHKKISGRDQSERTMSIAAFIRIAAVSPR